MPRKYPTEEEVMEWKVKYALLLETFKKVLVQNVQLQNEILERDCK